MRNFLLLRSAAPHRTPSFRRTSAAGRRGFTVAETVIAMMLILMLTAVCIYTCTVGVRLQRRAADSAIACSVAAEFVSAYAPATLGTSPDGYHHGLELALGLNLDLTFQGAGFAVTTTDEAGNETTGTATTLTRTFGERTFTVTYTPAAEGSVETFTYVYETPSVRVECEAALSEPRITATGYVKGYASAVCSYAYGGMTSQGGNA